MGTITTGVGLISGLDIQSLVTQLMQIESRPLELLKARIAQTQQQQTAYMTISARLGAARAAVQTLSRTSTFNVRKATSSNEDVLTAAVTTATPLGAHSFTVRSLVSTHQLVSQGFRDRDAARVGAGSMTFEVGQGHVAPTTMLNTLNAGAGVRRGVIRITDGSGKTADIDLTAAISIDDVLNAINQQSTVGVRASINGDRIVLTDTSGGTANDMRVEDVAGGLAAADLGIIGTSATGTIESNDLVSLGNAVRLGRLNDGIGVRFDRFAADLQFNLADGSSFDVNLSDAMTFDTHLARLNDGNGVRLGTIRVTNRSGNSAEIDLSAAQTVQDVKDAITAANIGVNITSIAGGKLIVSDSTGGTTSNLKIEDVSGYAAADLGITNDGETASFTGAQIYRMDTIGSVLRAIEYATGNAGKLTAEVSGNGIVLTDHTIGAFTTEVSALNNSNTLRDLGLDVGFDNAGRLETRDLVAGLNTVLLSSLNGGNGIAAGPIDFTRRDGTSFSLDFTGAQTLSDVVRIINQDGRLTAEVDSGGTRIRLTDRSSGTTALSATGAMAQALGLSTEGFDRLVSKDLQLQYITENTALSGLNLGHGITYGSFRITNSDGAVRSIRLLEAQHKTVGDVIKTINDVNMGVTARINANGDGIELLDTAGGTGKLTVAEENNGTTAASLKLVGEADATGLLTGSFAGKIDISPTDTLDSLATKINQAGLGVTASVINDGSSDTPYRLVLSSKVSGARGRVAFSTNAPALNLQTLSAARDATVIVGDPTSPTAVVITSSSNTVTDVVPGLTMNLLSTSTQPVQVTVSRDVDTLATDMKTFQKTFNDALSQIDELTKIIPETNQRGALQGDATVRTVQNRLRRLIPSVVTDNELTLRRLADVGISFKIASYDSGPQSPRLEFDEEKFREAFAEDPDAVRELFTLVRAGEDNKIINVGIATKINEELDALTRSGDGLLTRENNKLQDKVDQFNTRATHMADLLSRKEARLYAQFQAMESALAAMQTQQSSLASLASLASSMGSGA